MVNLVHFQPQVIIFASCLWSFSFYGKLFILFGWPTQKARILIFSDSSLDGVVYEYIRCNKTIVRVRTESTWCMGAHALRSFAWMCEYTFRECLNMVTFLWKNILYSIILFCPWGNITITYMWHLVWCIFRKFPCFMLAYTVYLYGLCKWHHLIKIPALQSSLIWSLSICFSLCYVTSEGLCRVFSETSTNHYQVKSLVLIMFTFAFIRITWPSPCLLLLPHLA